jgi:hypothetical protein
MVQNITLEEERMQDLVQGFTGGKEEGSGTGFNRKTGCRIWYTVYEEDGK